MTGDPVRGETETWTQRQGKSMWRERQRLEGCVFKPRNVEDC